MMFLYIKNVMKKKMLTFDYQKIYKNNTVLLHT